MTARPQILAIVVGILFAPVLLSAHHSWPVSRSKLVTVKGTVASFTWANPHPTISLDVRGEDGKTETWSIGGPAINRMTRNGWTNTTLKVGDVVTGIGYQFADGSRVVRLEKVVLADGKEMFVYGGR